jgi:FAD/FMN-containing dehydrogenase
MSFVEKLRAIVGDKGLVLDKQGMHPYLTDWRENYLGMALAIVRPATTEEVSEVVKLCAARRSRSARRAATPACPAAPRRRRKGSRLSCR